MEIWIIAASAAGLVLFLTREWFSLSAKLRAARYCYLDMSAWASELVHADGDLKRGEWLEKVEYHRQVFKRVRMSPIRDDEYQYVFEEA
jgi:hypothetical protein